MTSRSILVLACLLLAFLACSTTTTALPAPPSKPQPFRFDVSSPRTDTLWLVDSLAVVAWDSSAMPEGSTMDVALLHHEKKQSILLRRYIPSRAGSTLVNIQPDLVSGTYSLLLTVYKGRTSTIIGRSLVQSLILVDGEDVDPQFAKNEDENNINKKKTLIKKVKSNNMVVQESERVELTHQPTKGNLVLRAPYTVGWTIPKALVNARRARVNLLLVNRKDKVVRTLATNVDAKAGFMYVFLPEDTPLETYQIKVEIIGKGRKFSGYTHRFLTSLPAFSARSKSTTTIDA